MVNQEILKKVKQVATEVSGWTELSDDAYFENQGVDDLDMVDIVMILEKEFKISIPEDDDVSWADTSTPNKLAEYITKEVQCEK